MKGCCPCGGVTVTVPARPGDLTACNCTLCFKLGTLWGYYDPAGVRIEGATHAFRRSDIEVWLETRFCPVCSAVIAWSAVRELETPRMGVNMRLFEPEALVGLLVRFPDGRADHGEGDRPPPVRNPTAFERSGLF